MSNRRFWYVVKVVGGALASVLLLLLTLKYALKTSPIVKLMALAIVVLSILYTYKLYTDKPKKNES